MKLNISRLYLHYSTMAKIHINLLGNFSVRYKENKVAGFEILKVKELFCYLIINHDKILSREKVSSRLWGNQCTTEKSKKYLRDTLWRLKSSLNAASFPKKGFLHVEPEWLQLISNESVHIDTLNFEKVYKSVKNISPNDINEEQTRRLDEVVETYQGNLLENWNQEWCDFERERILHMYILSLDKLARISLKQKKFEAGHSYVQKILKYDNARERTHRLKMLMYAKSGNRIGAIRQYKKCAAILRKEMDVEPSRLTKELYRKIKKDSSRVGFKPARPSSDKAHTHLNELVSELEHLTQSLNQIQINIGLIKSALQNQSEAEGVGQNQDDFSRDISFRSKEIPKIGVKNGFEYKKDAS